MKTRILNLRQISIVLLLTLLGPMNTSEFVHAQNSPPGIVEKVNPASAAPGESHLTVTITLLNLGTPPVPPSHVTPTNIRIGTMEGRNIQRKALEITGVFDIPTNITGKFKDVVLIFPGPNNQSIVFTKPHAFEIEGGDTGEDPAESNNVAPSAGGYVIVDTGQETCYDNNQAVNAPQPGQPFYGQDAQYSGVQPSYRDNGDGTITDLNTGLMWQQGLPDEKYTYTESINYADSCTLAGYTDWRLPTTKELYSLILFSGRTGMTESTSIPYLDTDYFDFRFGGAVNSNERHIDAQYVTSTIYKGTTMGGNETMFGVNMVDGRIKGYPTSKDFEVKLVRGDSGYGINDLTDNGDGTLTDRATGLMWDRTGSSNGMNWEDALAWAQQKNTENYLGYSDWRLPNAKELHSIVDYNRSLSYTKSAAISPLFNVPVITDEKGETNYPFYWTSTTHDDGPSPNKAVYICFGEALGYMNGQWMDVHGAGAQRSDPKNGDPDDYPTGHGPQGDAIRIYNYVRLVRNVQINSNVSSEMNTMGMDNQTMPTPFLIVENYPNPFNPTTTISYHLPTRARVRILVCDMLGKKVRMLVNGIQESGSQSVVWDGTDDYGRSVGAGMYLYRIQAGNRSLTRKMVLVR